ncbi:MAG: epoxyqueuosine reductase QueH [Synergistetes bacterium]|nr:epoxyqueuosine reductase QueH [Synergistota bacterium]
MSRKKRLLLHICCAPDATIPYILLSEEYEVVGYFYGSNIHPLYEYKKRIAALQGLSERWGMPIIVEKYEPSSWLKKTAIFRDEPEGGRRCRICFFLQLDSAARVAAERGIHLFTTTLTISPHKDVDAINTIGTIAGKRHGVHYIPHIFRKKDGFKKSVYLSRLLGLYRQNYCGCIFSR